MDKRYLKALILFNEKADKLNNLTFTKYVTTQKHGFTLSFQIDGPVSVERRGPDEEAIDAFVLTFRFFIQDNEESSLRKQAKLYGDLLISYHKKDKFEKYRNNLNEFLDSQSFFSTNGNNWTKRQILEIFIYGGLAHANKKKKEIYDHWMSNQVLKPMITDEFVNILKIVLVYIMWIKSLNEQVIEDLEHNT